MSLRTRTLLIVALTLVALVLALYALTARIWMASIAVLEDHEVRRDVERAELALRNEIAHLSSITTDWGDWDDTYAFVEDGNENYVATNLTPPSLAKIDLHVMVFAHSSGRIVKAMAVDLKTQAEASVPVSFRERLDPALHGGEEAAVCAGLVRLDEGILMLAARRCLTSRHTGPPRGMVLFGRFVDADLLARLSAQTQLSLSLHSRDEPGLAPELRQAFRDMSPERKTLLRPLDEATYAGYVLLQPAYGESAFLLAVSVPRGIRAEGRSGLRYLVGGILLSAFVFGAMTLLVIERQVLASLHRLTDEVRRIGSAHDLSLRTSVLRNDELGRMAASVNGMLDALETANRKMEESAQALRRSEERNRSLVETAGSAILLVSEDGRVMEWNPEAERVFGVPRAEAVGKEYLASFVPEDSRATVATDFRKVLAGEPTQGFEHAVRRPDGTIRTLLWNLTRLPLSPVGRPGVLAIGQDITERKRTEQALHQREEQLRQAQKMEAIGRLAGGIAHDFNNLLMVVLGYAELLVSRLGDRDPLSTFASEIRKAGERAASLTQQLLAFGRKQVVQPRLLDMNVFVTDMGGMLRRMIGEDIELTTKLPPGLDRVKVDPSQVTQVLLNLVANARDAMPNGGRLLVETETVVRSHEEGEVPPGRYVGLQVTDDGQGMEPETLAHIFEPFFTTKPGGKGTGLGLATVHGIVRQNEGHISVESAPGRGTTIRILWPSAGLEQERPAAAEEAAAAAAGGSETILVVEDQPSVRDLAAKLLRMRGYTVLEADQPDTAVRLCREHADSIELLLTDVVMPKMNGGQLAQLLLAEQPGMKVLFMSGYADDPEVRKAIITGAAFLQKPFTPVALAGAVRRLLDGG
ncbi:MAG: PAS domain S-box protein [Planctomycetes bacterium]|nr:PAS domain S-box protein [Planctomycetota bacterium]